MKNKDKHPCFNAAVKGKFGRIHLPVAPKCNIQCNYCNRKYDCVNESRPGVTSAVLNPKQAIEYLHAAIEKESRISTIGIAGPGDPFANPDEVMETLRAIHNEFPDFIFCLSTNGLNLYPYIDELAELGVTHVTITVNTIDPEIGSKIYSWVRYKKRMFRGVEGAKILLKEQLSCIKKLKEKDITIKINSILVPGINDDHIMEVAEKMAELKVDLFNCIPLLPTAETKFADLVEPGKEKVHAIRTEAEKFLPQMKHCQRCRADAVGLLGKDNHSCLSSLQTIAFATPKIEEDRPFVAVGSHEGLMVNRHLGDCDFFQIFKKTENGYETTEKRIAPKSGGGDQRWVNVAELLNDCSALLVNGIGNRPMKVIKKEGLEIIEMSGFIEEGLDHVFKGLPLRSVRKRDMFKCGAECSGTGLGCG